jgi:hypothetical protein
MGYDDTDNISRIEAAMAADPGLSRRAAIIAVVGESGLRRIEKKMVALDEKAEGRQPLLADRNDLCAAVEKFVDKRRETVVWTVSQTEDFVCLVACQPQLAAAVKADGRIEVINFCIVAAGVLGGLVFGAGVGYGEALRHETLFGMIACGGATFFCSWFVAGSLSSMLLIPIFGIFFDGTEAADWKLRARRISVLRAHGPLKRYVLTDKAVYECLLKNDELFWKRVDLKGASLSRDGGDATVTGLAASVTILHAPMVGRFVELFADAVTLKAA